MAKTPCPFRGPRRDGRGTVACMWDEGHKSPHEQVVTMPDGTTDVHRYDRVTGELYPPAQHPR